MTERFIDRLLEASFRGVAFQVLAASETTGRRFVRFDYPGRDEAEHEDLGAADGPIRLDCLLIGDDVLDQVVALRDALRQPGPGRLVHPWAGEFDAVVAPGALAEVKWDLGEGRVARATLTFERAAGAGAGASAKQAALTPDATDSLWSEVSGWLNGLSTLTEARAVATQVLGLADLLATLWGRLAAGGVPSELATVLNAFRLTATTAAAAATAARAAEALGSGIPAACADLAARLSPVPPPALAAVATLPPLTGGQRRAAVRAVRAASASLLNGAVKSRRPAAAGLGLSIVAAAVAAAAALDFDSRQDAEAERDALAAVLAAQAEAVTRTEVAAQPGAAAVPAGLWRAAVGLRRAVLADVSRRAGTLPAVIAWTPAGGVPALVGLHTLFGPAGLVARLDDLAARNPGLRHPGALPATALEVLDA